MGSKLANLHLVFTSQQISVILRVSNGQTLTQTFLETSILLFAAFFFLASACLLTGCWLDKMSF